MHLKNIGRGKEISVMGSTSTGKLTHSIQHIKVNPNWAYQPDENTDLNDMVRNPIPFVGISKDLELAMLFDGNDTRQSKYENDVSIDISKLQTLQPFVLKSGLENYQRFDLTERPYVVEYKGKYYLLDGNHRVANAKLKGDKLVKVDISHRVLK
jgi:hypothetical protein